MMFRGAIEQEAAQDLWSPPQVLYTKLRAIAVETGSSVNTARKCLAAGAAASAQGGLGGAVRDGAGGAVAGLAREPHATSVLPGTDPSPQQRRALWDALVQMTGGRKARPR